MSSNSQISEKELFTAQTDKKIQDNVNIRALASLYLYLYPEKYRMDLAEELGVNQMMLSRTLSSDPEGLRKEWVEPVKKIIGEMDLEAFEEYFDDIKNAKMRMTALNRYEQIQTILPQYLKENGYTVDAFYAVPQTDLAAYIAECSDGEFKWHFCDVDIYSEGAQQIKYFAEIADVLERLSAVRNGDNVSVYTSSMNTFEEIAKTIKRTSRPKIKQTLLLIDFENNQVLRELSSKI